MIITRKIDASPIHSDETRGVDSMESHEFLSDVSPGRENPNVFINTQQFQGGGQLMSRYSDEHHDFSIEQVRAILASAGQLAPTQTNNGPAGQMTGLQTPNMRNPVLIHSDEHDFSDELSLLGILPNAQQQSSSTTPMASSTTGTAAAGQEPNRGQRIFNKQPDERYIVSARPGKQVIIRTGSILGSPIQTTSIHKATYGHSDEHDDYSDEVRSILAPPNTQNNVPANNGGRITANIPGSVYRLRSNRPASLPWREGEDDVQVQIDPVTKQVVNIRTELRDSLEHDVDFSDAITSRIVVSPTLVVSPVNTNGNVQPTPLNGRLLSALHSDELYDDSYEVKVNLNRPNGQNLTGPVHFISRHSDEHDDSLEMVRGIPSAGQVRPVLPVQTAVNGERFIVGKHSDEVDDFSLEDYHDAVRSGRTQLPIASAGLPTVTTGVEHLLRHSDEHDSSSIELIRSLGNLPGIAQSPMVQQQGVQGVQLIQKHSSELDDTSVEVILVRNQTGSGLHLISQNSDEHDISLEVVRPVLNPQIGQNPAAAVTPVQGLQVISRHSHEDDDISLEVQLIRNETAPGHVTRVLKQSDERHDTSLEVAGAILNLQNGQVAAEVRPVQSQIIPGEHLLRHSDEVDDISLELHHVTSGIIPPPITVGGIVPAVPAATGVEHRLIHSSDERDISLEDVIVRAPGVPIASQVGMIQLAPAQQGLQQLRDSDEHDNSKERLGQLLLSGNLNGSVTFPRDSLERDDLSLEVDINLLPEIQRLFRNVKIDGAPLPEVQSPPAAAAVTVAPATAAPVTAVNNQGNQAVQRMSRLLKQNVTLELREILANPVFQQKIQELDRRLKSAPDSRGKRLIEKYAEALALSSSSPSSHFNSAATSPTINSCLYLSLLITYWVSLWL